MADKKAAAPAKKREVKKSSMKGQRYECSVCGLAVSIDEDCGCVETCDIICCGEPMKAAKKKAKAG
jgi:hypothetical protein